MKKLFNLLVLLFPLMIFCQSVSSEKLISYAKYQDLKIIANDLDQKGFIVKSEIPRAAAVKTEDSKNSSEVIYCEIVKHNNAFSVVYTSPLYYDQVKMYLLGANSKLINVENGISFYENSSYRVGYNDSQKTIAIYTQLK